MVVQEIRKMESRPNPKDFASRSKPRRGTVASMSGPNILRPNRENLGYLVRTKGKDLKTTIKDFKVTSRSHVNNDNNNSLPWQRLWCWHHDSESLREFTRFTRWMQNSARRLPTFGRLWIKATDLNHRPACRQLGNYIYHRHLLLLSPKADTHFVIPRRVEGWVDLYRWLDLLL